MDRKTLITIFVLFLISSQLWSMVWDIGKGVIYILLLIFALSYLNPSVADEMKNIFKKIISLDFSFATKYITAGASYLGNFLRNKIIKQEQSITSNIQDNKVEPTVAPKLTPKVAPKSTPKVAPKSTPKAVKNTRTNVIRTGRRL